MTDANQPLLIKNIDTLVTMDEERRVINNAWILVKGNKIDNIGRSPSPDIEASSILDASNHIVIPGLVNTHSHFFQTLLRVVPSAQDLSLWKWLQEIYLPQGCLTDEMLNISTRIALSELILSGCTTSEDHCFLRVNDMDFSTEIEAAREMGVRLHLSRGCRTIRRSKSKDTIVSEDITEDEDEVLSNYEYLVKKHHDPNPCSMTRIDLAPTSLFTVRSRMLERSASLARQLGVLLHTHCYESKEEEEFCLEKYGKRPMQFAADIGWTGPDVWFAHAVHHNEEEISLMGKTKTGVAHCPTANMRLASGIAPVRKYIDNGVPVGLGVDGSAANDSSNLLAEARMAMLLQRVKYGADALTATQALELATLGGAKVLHRDDIGSIEQGKAADFISFNMNHLFYAGGMIDPVAALIFCQPTQVSFSVINGRKVVDNGQLLGVDLPSLINKHNLLSKKLIEITEKRYNHDLSTRIWRRL